MMKVVLKVYDLDNPKSSTRAMKVVSPLEGVESVKVDMEKKTLTVIGNIDPYNVVCKLRKRMHADIESAGPNKEGNKEAEEKKKKEAEEKKKQEEEEKKRQELLRIYYHNIGYYPYYCPSSYQK